MSNFGINETVSPFLLVYLRGKVYDDFARCSLPPSTTSTLNLRFPRRLSVSLGGVRRKVSEVLPFPGQVVGIPFLGPRSWKGP